MSELNILRSLSKSQGFKNFSSRLIALCSLSVPNEIRCARVTGENDDPLRIPSQIDV